MKKGTFQIALFLLSTFAFFTNCDQKKAQSSYDTFHLNEAANLAYGKMANLKGGDLSIHFLEVTEDSRCPEGTECVWAGQVKVSLKITTGGSDHNIEMLKKGKQKGGVTGNVGDYTVEMIEVNPYPKDGVKTEKKDYVFNFKVSQ